MLSAIAATASRDAVAARGHAIENVPEIPLIVADSIQELTKAKENLEKLGAWMNRNPDTKIQIEGHTCDIGTAEYNLALGERRATSGKMYLERLGISPNRLSTISYGEERPMLPNKDEANRAKNRRDEFVKMK